jgi:hypothetical protein
MRHDGRHLAEARERRLLREPLFRGLARGDVRANRDVLIRLAVVVKEGHDRRVHPVKMPVLGAVSDLAVPDASVGDRHPQGADELLRVQSELMMRWSWPINSSRLYPRSRRNLSLTYVILPWTSVVATIARVVERPFQVGELGCSCGVNGTHRYTWTWPLPKFS